MGALETRLININSLEFAEVLMCMAKESGLSLKEMDEHKLGITGVMCIDGYITGGPGFCGDLYIISWDGAPEFITVVGRTGNIKSDELGKLKVIANLGHCDCHWKKEKTDPEKDLKREA